MDEFKGYILSDEKIIYNDENIRVITYYQESDDKEIFTKVIFDDLTIGTTHVHSNYYNKDIGINIAYNKAKDKQDIKRIKQLQKEIDERVRKTQRFNSEYGIKNYTYTQEIVDSVLPSCWNSEYTIVDVRRNDKGGK